MHPQVVCAHVSTAAAWLLLWTCCTHHHMQHYMRNTVCPLTGASPGHPTIALHVRVRVACAQLAAVSPPITSAC